MLKPFQQAEVLALLLAEAGVEGGEVLHHVTYVALKVVLGGLSCPGLSCHLQHQRATLVGAGHAGGAHGGTLQVVDLELAAVLVQGLDEGAERWVWV